MLVRGDLRPSCLENPITTLMYLSPFVLIHIEIGNKKCYTSIRLSRNKCHYLMINHTKQYLFWKRNLLLMLFCICNAKVHVNPTAVYSPIQGSSGLENCTRPLVFTNGYFGKGEWKLPFARPARTSRFFGVFVIVFEINARTN